MKYAHTADNISKLITYVVDIMETKELREIAAEELAERYADSADDFRTLAATCGKEAGLTEDVYAPLVLVNDTVRAVDAVLAHHDHSRLRAWFAELYSLPLDSVNTIVVTLAGESVASRTGIYHAAALCAYAGEDAWLVTAATHVLRIYHTCVKDEQYGRARHLLRELVEMLVGVYDVDATLAHGEVYKLVAQFHDDAFYIAPVVSRD